MNLADSMEQIWEDEYYSFIPVERPEPRDLMASGLGGSGLSTEIKEPLLANYIHHLRSAPYCLVSSWHLHHNWVGDSLGQWVRELGWLDTLCTCVWIAEAWSNFSLKRESHVFVKAHVAQWVRSLTPGSLMHLAQVQSCSSWCDTEEMIYLEVLLLEGWCQYKRMGHKRSLVT